jgi:limonene 1,2-monooxygenase
VVTHVADWFELHEARLQLLPLNGSMPIAVASTTSPSGMTCAGKHGVGVLSLGAGLVGGRKDLAAQWAMGEESASAHGQTLRRDEWRLVIRVHLAESAEQAMAEVREGREYERLHYFRRVGGLKNDLTLEDEIELGSALVGTPDEVTATLRRLWEETGGFGGLLVLAHEWAGREQTLRSYELLARFVVPQFNGMLESLRASYDTVAANRRSYGGPAMAAIAKAYEDAGKQMPDDLTGANLR